MATRAKQAAKQPAAEAKHNVGKVVQVIGPVLDVEFEPERLPELYNALVIDHPGDGTPPVHLVAEVHKHIGRNQVRALAMRSPAGVVRGLEAADSATTIIIPVAGAALALILMLARAQVHGGDAVP